MADKPGTAQYHRKVTTLLQKQIDDRMSKQQELDEQYQQKQSEYLQLRAEIEQV